MIQLALTCAPTAWFQTAATAAEAARRKSEEESEEEEGVEDSVESESGPDSDVMKRPSRGGAGRNRGVLLVRMICSLFLRRV